MKTSDMKAAIFQKLDYDRTYFKRVLSLKASGQADSRMSKEDFANEVKRATLNVPVLEKLFNEKSSYEKGQAVTLPRNDDAFRVYYNLAIMLNMIQASEAGNYKAAVDYGSKIVIKDKKNLGLVANDDSNYYLKLYREFFYQMSHANFRLGKDNEAIKWLARLEADSDLQSLKKAAAEATKVDPKVERLAKLRMMPVALMPFSMLDKNKEWEWLGNGLPEVLTNDLVQHTDLLLAERSQLAKVLKEVQLSQAGITEDKLAKNVGQLLNVGSLIVGSYRHAGDVVTLSLRLVDAENGQILTTIDGKLPSKDVFPQARATLLNMLTGINWVDEVSRAEVMASRSPKTDTMKDLLQARLALASKSSDAKALYAKAAREDPAYAKLFDDLKNEFAGISAKLAVMPFVNSSGVAVDMWMVHGTGQALNADLPKIGFTVVERTELLPLISEKNVGQVLDPDTARKTAEKVGADFLVMGSLLHQKPLVRVDARFVDVRTGIVTQTVSAEGNSDEFMNVLVTLSTEIAKRFNEKLDQKTLASLAGKKMSKADFENFVRQELTKEQLARSLKPTAALDEAPKRSVVPFWGAVGGLAAGVGASATGFVMASQHQQAAAYTGGLIAFTGNPDEQARLTTRRNQDVGYMQTWNIVGGVGVGVAAVSAGYLVYDIFFADKASDKPPSLAAGISVDAKHTWVHLQGAF
jgi:TolB-like protein